MDTKFGSPSGFNFTKSILQESPRKFASMNDAELISNGSSGSEKSILPEYLRLGLSAGKNLTILDSQEERRTNKIMNLKINLRFMTLWINSEIHYLRKLKSFQLVPDHGIVFLRARRHEPLQIGQAGYIFHKPNQLE